MDNNLDDKKVESSTEEGTTSPSYTDPNAGYTEADAPEEKTDYVPRDVEAEEKPQQAEAESTAYTYGEPSKEAEGNDGNVGQSDSTSRTSDPNAGYQDGTYPNGAYHTGYNRSNTYGEANNYGNPNAYNGANNYGNPNGYGGANNYGNQNTYSGSNSYNGQNYNSQNPYQMPPKQLDPSPLSTGEWILTLIVGIVPCAGLIIYLIWAFSNSGNLNRRNYCRASLIIMAVSYVLVIFFIIMAVVGSLSAYRY